jgi:hypothetical protein
MVGDEVRINHFPVQLKLGKYLIKKKMVIILQSL